MAVIRGGRKGDKPAGSCRRKRQSISSKLRDGMVNIASGKWVPFSKARVPEAYWERMQASSQWRNERNTIARRRRGGRDGSKSTAA
jgi:hypothetical protein